MVGGHRDQDDHDHGDTEHVPPDREVVEHRHEVAAEDVDQAGDDEDEHEQGEVDVRAVVNVCRGRGLREVEDEVDAVEAEQVHQEGGRDVHHGGHHRDQADQVEPAGEPAPAGAAELERPVVDAAGRRIRGGELGHRDGDQQDQAADQRPGDRDRDRPAVLERLPVRREAAGEDADDRERDREVREPAPAALELLFVAELCEALLVGGQSPRCAHRLTPPRGKRFGSPSFIRDDTREPGQKSSTSRPIATAASGQIGQLRGDGSCLAPVRGAQPSGSKPASTCSVPCRWSIIARAARVESRSRTAASSRRCCAFEEASTCGGCAM